MIYLRIQAWRILCNFLKKDFKMLKHSQLFLFAVSIILIFQCCKSKSTFEDFNVEFGYEYFPVEIGKYQTYIVDSIVYDIDEMGETITIGSRTFVKYVIADTITDNLDRPGFKVERYERKSDSLDWDIKDIWAVVLTDDGAEWIEENMRFLKMVFPLREGLEWDGNRYIDITTIIPIAGESVEVFKSWSYEALTIDESEQIGDFTFENVATISQANSENLIELRQSEEKYAKGIGLVYRTMKILDTQCIIDCAGWTWEDKAEKGFILTQQIIDYN